MKTFITLDVALDINRQLPGLARQIALRDRNLEDQLTRAAHSVALNLGEGNRKSGKDIPPGTLDLDVIGRLEHEGAATSRPIAHFRLDVPHSTRQQVR